MFRGSIGALITPFNKDGSLDVESLKDLILWHIESKTDGLVLCGTTGEAPTLSDEEKLKIFETAVFLGKGKINIIAGTGTYSTQKSYELTKKAKDIGVEGALIVVPYYNRPSMVGILKHYEMIGQVGLPLILYHHPKRTGVAICLQDLINLQKMPYISAIKEASGDLNFNQKLILKSSKNILSGDDALVVETMKAGGMGSISVLANIIPEKWKKICDYCLLKDFDKASKIFETYSPLIEAMFLESNPICIKYALSLMKKCMRNIRLPLVEPCDENKKKIKKVLQELNLI